MDPRARLSWQWTMDWPEAVVYEGLDPQARYTVRMSGYGKLLLRINGEPVAQTGERIETGEIMECAVPPEAVKNRRIVLTWDRPLDEMHLNWRQHSRLAEVWLIKNQRDVWLEEPIEVAKPLVKDGVVLEDTTLLPGRDVR